MKETTLTPSVTQTIDDRTNFVSAILDYGLNAKASQHERKRLVNLVGKEYEMIGTVEKEILERLEKIERSVKINTVTSVENVDNQITSPSFIKKPNPIETKLFLSLFNNSEGLKYLTHRFNSEKPDYETFISLCRDEFDKAVKDYPNVPNALLARIEEFAFSTDPKWYIRKNNEKIMPKLGWSELSFKEWYKQDFNLHPGYDSKWNNTMVIPFKESIEVRAGNLLSILDEAIQTALGGSRSNFVIDINTENINMAEFYTDVDLFRHAITNIISIIKDVAERNFCFKISIDYINETLKGEKFKKVIITHIDSESSKNSNDPTFTKGDLNSIKNNLFGLCNYEIEAKFLDGYKRKIILTDDEESYKRYVKEQDTISITNPSNVLGFTHILKFY